MNHLQAVNTSAAERYLLDEMSEIERHAFEEHYFSCDECAENVRLEAVMREGAKAGFAGMAPSVVAGSRSPRPSLGWRPALALPWAAAAALAVALGYQSLTLGPAERRLEPQALTPITLRPASRGAEPVVTLDKRAAAVTLAVDLSFDQTVELAYDLRTTNDKIVASGQIAAPPPGAPLLLLIPVWTLSPSEHYILSIRSANARDVLEEYRFAVAAQ